MHKSRIEYVLYHLGLLVDLDEVRDYFVIGDESEVTEKCIYFPVSDNDLNIKKVIYLDDDIPILFPVSESLRYYQSEGGSIIFEHDLLSSAFYLLSGLQEFGSDTERPLNRYSWQDSIQKKLEITANPVVNYYFKVIIEAIEKFCSFHDLKFKRKHPFREPVLFMSHDIDRVKCYNFPRIKMFLKKGKFFSALEVLLKMILKVKDPWWNFDYFINLEKQQEVKSTWFFLGQGIRHLDAYYSYKDKKISDVISKLNEKGHETGIHGTISSAFNSEELQKNLVELQNVSEQPIKGIRQHWLNYYPQETGKIHSESVLRYDTTLGFHDHAGFRNSYCYPFKLYDFIEEKMLNNWELPLIVMDGSLFDYQMLNDQQARREIGELQGEIMKFKGVFTILIHNNFVGAMSSKLRKQRKQFYEDLLKSVIKDGYVSYTGSDICNLIDRKE